MNITLLICLIIMAFLLAVNMVLSAMAASYDQDRDIANAHKYSMWAAISSGVLLGVVLIVLGIYIYRARNEAQRQAVNFLGGKIE
jgi:predicted transporter